MRPNRGRLESSPGGEGGRTMRRSENAEGRETDQAVCYSLHYHCSAVIPLFLPKKRHGQSPCRKMVFCLGWMAHDPIKRTGSPISNGCDGVFGTKRVGMSRGSGSRGPGSRVEDHLTGDLGRGTSSTPNTLGIEGTSWRLRRISMSLCPVHSTHFPPIWAQREASLPPSR